MKTNRIELDRGAFTFLDVGPEDGRLALLLHGFPDVPRTFEAQLEALANAGYRAVAPWLRGYAPSTLQGPFDGKHLTEDVLALANALSPGRPVALVGHDWGSVLGHQAVREAPERFSHFVALAVPHPTSTLRNMRRHPRQLARNWYMLFFQLGRFADLMVVRHDFALIEKLWRDWSPGFHPPPEHLAEVKRCLGQSMPAPVDYYRAMLRPSPAMARQMASIGRTPIRVPTLHLHGADDGCIGPEIAEGQERYFAGLFRSERVPGAGHFLHMEKPDVVNASILDWLGR